MTGYALLLLAFALVVGSAAQAAGGVGLGLVAGGFMVAAVGRPEAIQLLALVSLPSIAVVLWGNRHAVRWRAALLLLAPAVVTTPAWAGLFSTLAPELVARIAGGAVIGAVCLLAAGRLAPRLTGWVGASRRECSRACSIWPLASVARQ